MKLDHYDFPETIIDDSLRVRRYAGSLRVRRYAGSPNSHHDCAVLLRASGRATDAQDVEIVVEQHKVLSYTPCGAWIETWGKKRFVNLRAGKQWASADEAEAIDQLWHRKRAQVRILSSRLAEAEQVKEAMAKAFDKKEPAPRTRYWSGYGEEY